VATYQHFTRVLWFFLPATTLITDSQPLPPHEVCDSCFVSDPSQYLFTATTSVSTQANARRAAHFFTARKESAARHRVHGWPQLEAFVSLRVPSAALSIVSHWPSFTTRETVCNHVLDRQLLTQITT
jgi:hypothetical protein